VAYGAIFDARNKYWRPGCSPEARTGDNKGGWYNKNKACSQKEMIMTLKSCWALIWFPSAGNLGHRLTRLMATPLVRNQIRDQSVMLPQYAVACRKVLFHHSIPF
jgi:hypothetical protein